MADLANIVAVGVLLGGIYALVSVGLNLIFGVIRIVNFAQGEFVMLGMYATYAAYTFLRLDPYVALIAVVPGLFIVGAVVQRLILAPLRTEPTMQIFATFGLLMLIENVVLALTRGTAYSVTSPLTQTSIGVAGVQVGLVRLVVLAAATIVAAALGLFLKRTMLGRAIRAVAQDRSAAQLVGVDVDRIYMLTFGIGAALAGLAGCLLTPIYTLSPQIGTSFILPAFAVIEEIAAGRLEASLLVDPVIERTLVLAMQPGTAPIAGSPQFTQDMKARLKSLPLAGSEHLGG